jgi:hypothetical protein
LRLGEGSRLVFSGAAVVRAHFRAAAVSRPKPQSALVLLLHQFGVLGFVKVLAEINTGFTERSICGMLFPGLERFHQFETGRQVEPPPKGAGGSRE